MQENIQKMLSYFTTRKRGEDTIVVLKDDAPEYLRDSVHDAHGDRLPDDWIYEKFYHILQALDDYTITSADDIEENRHEIVDGLVDIYNTDRTAWLARHLHNASYCDEASEEYGSAPDDDMFDRIGRGQYYAIDQIYSHVVSLLEELNTNDDE